MSAYVLLNLLNELRKINSITQVYELKIIFIT